MDSLLYQLQEFDPGMVWLDSDNIITAMNAVAMETLGDHRGKLIGQEVLQLHPDKSRDKVNFLLADSSCPVASPPPMTMMINIPERMLLIKVAKMCGPDGGVGTSMVFYDLTELTSVPDETILADKEEPIKDMSTAVFSRKLLKLPVYKNKQILLIDLDTVACIKANGHYSTLYTRDDNFLCNLSLADLDGRIESENFIRTHRSYIVNLTFAKALDKVDEQWNLITDTAPEVIVPISRNNVAKVKQMLGLA